jgi:hypothetical protein
MEPGSTETTWQRWRGPAGVTAIVGVLSLVLLFWNSTKSDQGSVGSGSGSAPTKVSKPDSLADWVAQRDIWKPPPPSELYPSAYKGAPIDGATVDSGDVKVATPAELVNQAAALDGKLVYLVGRVANIRAVQAFDLEGETQLAPQAGSDAYIGSAQVFWSVGDYIYAVGRVAAIGTSHRGSPRGARRASPANRRRCRRIRVRRP